MLAKERKRCLPESPEAGGLDDNLTSECWDLFWMSDHQHYILTTDFFSLQHFLAISNSITKERKHCLWKLQRLWISAPTAAFLVQASVRLIHSNRIPLTFSGFQSNCFHQVTATTVIFFPRHTLRLALALFLLNALYLGPLRNYGFLEMKLLKQ